MQTKSKRVVGSIFFAAGIISGLLLAGATIWEEFEGVSYYYTGTSYSQFNGLQCPTLMTRSEKGTIQATFNNPTNEEYDPYYQVEIGGILPRQFEDQIAVPPHQSKSITWTADANDIDLGFFIFAKLDVLPDALFPTRETTCGIIVLNLPGLTGGQIFTIALSLSLFGMVAGLVLWENAHQPLAGSSLNLMRAMQALSIVVLLAMLAGFLGGWLAGTILCAIALLMLVMVFGLAVS